jgi:hypothetical protein
MVLYVLDHSTFLGMVMQQNTAITVRTDYSASKRTVNINAARSMLAQPLLFVESPDRSVLQTENFRRRFLTSLLGGKQ